MEVKRIVGATEMDPADSRFEDWVKVRREFAAERSNQDAEQSNDNSRAAAQAAILINGGAASAVLAFLSASISKDKFDIGILSYAAIALGVYALGVAFAALMILCMNHALKHWNKSWQQVMKAPENEVSGTIEHKQAQPWYFAANGTFAASVCAFLIASAVLAFGFYKTSRFVSAPGSQSLSSSSPVSGAALPPR